MTDMVLTLGQRAKSIVKDPFFWLGVKEMGGTALGIAAWGLVTGVGRGVHGRGQCGCEGLSGAFPAPSGR